MGISLNAFMQGFGGAAAATKDTINQALAAEAQKLRDERMNELRRGEIEYSARLHEDAAVRADERKREPGKRAASAAEGIIASRVNEMNPVKVDDEGNPMPLVKPSEREQAMVRAGAYEKEGLTTEAHQYRQDIHGMDTLASTAKDREESRRDRREAAQLAADTKLELGRMNIDSRELIAASSNETRQAIAAIAKAGKDGTDRVLLHQTVSSIDRDIAHNQDSIKQLRAANKGLMPGDKVDEPILAENNARIAELDASNKTLTGSKYEFLRAAGVNVPESVTAPAAAKAPPAPLSLPQDKTTLVPGKVYKTARGPAKWNGTAFEPVR